MDAFYETATFRPGDVVLLRVRDGVSQAGFERMADHFERMEEHTGVKFVLIGSDLEVIVPIEEAVDGSSVQVHG